MSRNTVQDIIPGVLNKFDQHLIAINVVYSTLLDNYKNISIEYLEKTVDKVGHVIMKHFKSHVGNYGEMVLHSDDNIETLHTTNINTITVQAYGNLPKYILSTSLANLESMLEYWEHYITVNEEILNFS